MATLPESLCCCDPLPHTGHHSSFPRGHLEGILSSPEGPTQYPAQVSCAHHGESPYPLAYKAFRLHPPGEKAFTRMLL